MVNSMKSGKVFFSTSTMMLETSRKTSLGGTADIVREGFQHREDIWVSIKLVR